MWPQLVFDLNLRNLRQINAGTVDAGIKTLKFAGADFIFTHKYASDSVFLVNTKEMKLYAIKEFYEHSPSAGW